MVEVFLPGTGGVMPLKNRHLACCWMEHNGRALLIDCGEGTQVALNKCGRRLSRLKTIFFTHFHADHIAGLPGLLLSLGNYGKTDELMVAGPPGLRETVKSLLAIAPQLPFPIRLMELEGAEKFESCGYQISSLVLQHGIPCLAYCLILRRKPVFNPEKARKRNVPREFFKLLHEGECVTNTEGERISPDMVLDGMRPPIKICYITDTRPVKEMDAFAKDADLLISEGMYGVVNPEDKKHMCIPESIRLAENARVEKLWVTHYSPSFQQPEKYIPADKKTLVTAGYDGISCILKGK